MKLYSYWRSTTSYRVRAALNLKGSVYDTVALDIHPVNNLRLIEQLCLKKPAIADAHPAAEQLCHHASGGCGMKAGDLLGSETNSGLDRSEYGSLMELSWAGREPFTLDTGETRTFIEDGDPLTLRGAAKGGGYQIGFGTCSGTILPATKFPV